MNTKWKCIIFDCDGVLVNSLPLSNQVMLEMLKPFGIVKQFKKVIENFNGGALQKSFQKIEEIIGEKLPEDFEEQYRRLCYQKFKEELQPVEGIVDLLKKINLPICVASSGPPKKIISNLRTTQLLKFFKGNIFSSYQINSWKPEPDIFLHAANKMGFLPSECLVVEDSLDGIIAARTGGFDVVGLAENDKHFENFSKTDAIIIHSLLELSPILSLNMDKILKRKIVDVSQLRGTFQLRSGKTSNIYFDKYKFESDPVILKEICNKLKNIIPKSTEVLAGLEMGGIPIATVLSQVTNIPVAFIRKEAKEYGTCNYAEGADMIGKTVIIVEDVVSSGGAILDAVNKMRADDIEITEAYCVIDRETGGKENLAAKGIKLKSLFKMSDLISVEKRR